MKAVRRSLVAISPMRILRTAALKRARRGRSKTVSRIDPAAAGIRFRLSRSETTARASRTVRMTSRLHRSR